MTVQTFYTLTCDDCAEDTKTRREGERPVGWGGPTRYRNPKFGEDYCPECTRKRIAEDWPEDIELPCIGQEIYLRTHFYIDHGEDDVVGGLATITDIFYNPGCKNPVNRVMISTHEHDGSSSNYLLLMQDQDKLREQFGKSRAHPDPDYA